jgi:UPF0716 protein FxsA
MLIFLLLVAVPIIEIALFIEIGGWLGTWTTIGVVVLTAAIGTALLRIQGLATLGELQRRLAAGEDPGATLAHGAMILVAGLLLLTPGFFTDAVGFLLLAPPVRAAAIRFSRSRMMHVQTRAGMRMSGGVHRRPAGPGTGPGTVDGEYQVIDPSDGRSAPGPEAESGAGTEVKSGGGAARGDSGWARASGERRKP